VGVHVISTTDGDLEQARANGRELAGFIWQNRSKLVRTSLTPDEAFAEALRVDAGPVVVNDVADNPGGGSPGDATHVLRALLATGVDNACFGYIADPQVVEQAVAAGPGSTIQVRLGGKTDTLHGAPIEAEAYVKLVTDGVFTPQSGLSGSMGRSVRLLIGGVDVVVATLPNQVFHPAVFRLHGIEPERYRLVVLKGSNHFRAGFQDMAKAIVTADSPGLTTLRIEFFERSRSPRPIWPLDAEADYQPAEPRSTTAQTAVL
jgi:microcystin degradation protein MlrC